MTDTPIRVGFVGAGANTRLHHLPKLKAQPGVELVAVANRSRESGDRVAREFGIARVHGDWREVVEARDVDAVCIGTWPYLHAEVTTAALAAGKHVLCEARMAMNAAEGRRMLEAARRAPRLVTQLVPAPHTLELDGTLRALLAEGYAGEVLAVEVRAPQQARFADPDEPLHWRQNVALSGNNILNMGIWYEAMMRWLGPARRVMAMTKIAIPRRKDESGAWHEVRVPDHVDILATLGTGAVAHLRFSALTVLAPPAEAWIFGREGTLRIEADARRLSGGATGRQGAAGDPHPGRAPDRLAGRGGVRQRDPRPRDGLAHDVRGRGPLHGVHRRRGPERRQRPGGGRPGALSPATFRPARPQRDQGRAAPGGAGQAGGLVRRPVAAHPPRGPVRAPDPAVLGHVSRLVGLLVGAVLAVEVAAAVSRRSRRRKLHRWVHEHRRSVGRG